MPESRLISHPFVSSGDAASFCRPLRSFNKTWRNLFRWEYLWDTQASILCLGHVPLSGFLRSQICRSLLRSNETLSRAVSSETQASFSALFRTLSAVPFLPSLPPLSSLSFRSPLFSSYPAWFFLLSSQCTLLVFYRFYRRFLLFSLSFRSLFLYVSFSLLLAEFLSSLLSPSFLPASFSSHNIIFSSYFLFRSLPLFS